METVVGTTGDDQFDNALDGGSAGDDSYFGLGDDDWLAPTLGNDILDGGPGRDVAIYSFFPNLFPNGITINNTQTAIGRVLAGTVDKRGFGTDTLIGLENFHGTQADDAIYLGDHADETYTFDEAGDDLVVAGSNTNAFLAGRGNDTYKGSAQRSDDVIYDYDGSGITQGVTVNLPNGTATDGWGFTDSLSGIENVTGTRFDDDITLGSERGRAEGLEGNDILCSGGDRDDLRGGAADDTFDGTIGERSRADYSRDVDQGGLAGVAVDLALGTATDGFGDTDTLIGIEDARGTPFDDVIRGDAGRNRLSGREGDDLLEGRGGRDNLQGDQGNDTLDGGADQDFVWYGDDEEFGGLNGVVVDLAAGTATDGFGDTDTLISIEEVGGTNFDDTILGNSDRNFLEGRAGNDVLRGFDGDDDFRGGAGDDTLDGGDGDFDEAKYHRDADSGATQGITVDLGAGTATDGFGDTGVPPSGGPV